MKFLTLSILMILSGTILTAQQIDSTALIIIDIQDFYFPGGASELVEPEKAADQAAVLLDHFRKKNGLVVHVKHLFEPGGDINKRVKPVDGEKIFSKKEVNAFLNTGLNDYLKANHIKNVVLCGMQTHMCLEAGARAAHDYGYACTVIEDACATRDLTFEGVTVEAKDVHFSTLATLRNYAKIIKLEDYLK
ncbi:isochorismatase family protein [Maribellus comscasis]|uniref:Isochorismatase family protein n=1 Tax=Maribellus comscasis TaxID=2681766 RepID=A0A6I6JS76_9BACT|nr:cysteine hydrolase family protein [Maribellus comscasis]QGY42977.1 isochorismatase family protein [Maribellus comscasis]